MPLPSLKEFAEPVPVCQPTSTLAELLDIFRASGCSAVVVVSQQHYPQGIIRLQHLLPYLSSPPECTTIPVARKSGDFHNTLSQLEPSLIEPLAILPAQLSLSQFWLYLQQAGDPLNQSNETAAALAAPLSSFVLVTQDGQFLGLLNHWLLLRVIAANSSSSATPATDESPQSTHVNPLVQLLEQLPLPLSLQTADGQILSQNRTWRQQIGVAHESEDDNSTTANLSSRACPTSEEGNTSGESSPPHSLIQRKESLTPAATGCSCAIAPPYHIAVTQPPATLLASPPCTIAQKISSTKTPSPLAADTQKSNSERVFSFTKIPLSPSVVRQENSTGTMSHSNTIGFNPADYCQMFEACPAPIPNLCVVLAQDTTERQLFAAELAAKNADLVHLNRLKDEFLACISHELKTPLTAVVGLSTLLQNPTLGTLNERQARYARLIHQSGRQLMKVVNDILDLTRMETGQLKLTPEPLQIESVCDRAYTQTQHHLAETTQHEDDTPTPTIHFSLDIEPGIETLVADELRLRQMLVHLLSNAFKFTEAGGEVGLRVNRWEGWIAFTIWDTGIGIPPEKQHLIFEKFQQLESPLNRCFNGTGLGLVLTQRLARLHGGDISFISKPNQGSEFTLLLPPCPPQKYLKDSEELDIIPEDQTPTAPTVASQNRLVLVVETVPHYLETLAEQLNSLGYRVVIARSGTEALAKARHLQPRVILLNPLLPQLSGWDVLTLLKFDAQTSHIPILVTATQAEKQQATHYKADSFLSLPVQLNELIDSLNQLDQLEPGQATTRKSLTILRLSPGYEPTEIDSSWLSQQLTEQRNLEGDNLQYRVLEAEDLEQAELLVRVWNPDIALLDGAKLSDPQAYLNAFATHPELAELPLVTLEHRTTESANQIARLHVYPCLAPNEDSKMSTLLEVIQVAAGMSCRPSILVIDTRAQEEPCFSVEDKGQESAHSSPSRRDTLSEQKEAIAQTRSTPHSRWRLALLQYLQTAGYNSLLSPSWKDVSRRLSDHSVDLLLIILTDSHDTTALEDGLVSLAKLPQHSPIFVLDCRTQNLGNSQVESLLQQLASNLIQGQSQSMHQLLEQINQQLHQH